MKRLGAAGIALVTLLGCGGGAGGTHDGAVVGPTNAGGGGGKGGTGGMMPPMGNSGGAGGQTATAKVALSEIMYHPVLEDGEDDLHEFVELHNPGTSAVSLAGWKLSGQVEFTFPAGTSIGPGRYLVVAKDRAKLAAVPGYGIDAAALLGNYEGSLDNGGGTLALLDAAGQTVESVKYDDKAPWPIGADALGASDEFLPASRLPIEAHRYEGFSLERVSFAHPATDVSNWATSPLDGPTPGRASANAAAVPPAIVEAFVAAAEADGGPIAAGKPVLVRARLTAGRQAPPLAVEWFVDDPAKSGESVETVPMTAGSGDQAGTWEAHLPGAPENAIVRYRFVVTAGGKATALSPRPSDPFEWHAYFAPPALASKARVYHLFVAPTDWGKMWTNVKPDDKSGRVQGCPLGVLAGNNPQMPTGCPPNQCTPNPNYNARVPATFVFDGQVYDVRVRYQGSKVNRLTGRNIAKWPNPGFAGPTAGSNPPPAISWSVKFPRYSRFEGKGMLLLNKLTKACPGFPNALGGRLANALGLAASSVRYARMQLNGLYYNYVMDIDRVDEDLVKKQWPKEPAGDLFKNDGLRWDEGPWGWGDGRLLEPYCGFTPRQRWSYNLAQKTNPWNPPDDIIALHEGLEKASAAGPAALKAFLDQNMDVPRMIDHIALVNWAGVWDDAFHNQFFYKRRGGKWMWLSWDYDATIICESATKCLDGGKSLFIGKEGDASNRNNIWNHFKDAFFQVYQAEYVARLKELGGTVFAPENVDKMIDEIAATYDGAEAAQALPGVEPGCSAPDTIARMKRFVRERLAKIQAL